jgi:hypothetical protein
LGVERGVEQVKTLLELRGAADAVSEGMKLVVALRRAACSALSCLVDNDGRMAASLCTAIICGAGELSSISALHRALSIHAPTHPLTHSPTPQPRLGPLTTTDRCRPCTGHTRPLIRWLGLPSVQSTCSAPRPSASSNAHEYDKTRRCCSCGCGCGCGSIC